MYARVLPCLLTLAELLSNRKMYDFIRETHITWHPILREALSFMDAAYLQTLSDDGMDLLPKKEWLLRAFCQPLSSVRYVLLGESPYPRVQSANGYAFWDAAVTNLWQDSGLSKPVNRATSLRHIIKMLLHARGDLTEDFSQPAIAKLDKSSYIQTLDELFENMVNKGFLLLNASLVYESNQVLYHAKQWRPFMISLLQQLNMNQEKAHPITIILLGKVAAFFKETALFSRVIAEHPYNISFIRNQAILQFFKPMDLLSAS